MATKVKVGSFDWINGTYFAPDPEDNVEIEYDETPCYTCDKEIGHQNYWYCAQNGEEVHDGCRIPNLDEEGDHS